MPSPAQEIQPGRLRPAAAALSGLCWLVLLFLVLRFPPDGHEHGNFGQFLGRFHPLLVHGPVVLLLMVPLMDLAGCRPHWDYLRPAAAVMLAAAVVAAFAAAFDGWLLAWSGGYRGHDITRHMWGGVTLAAASSAALCARGSRLGRVAYPVLLVATLGVMIWTSHGGGSIAHGEGFLTDKMPIAMRAWLGMPDVPEKAAETAPGAKTSGVRAGPGSVNPTSPAFYSVHVAPLFARSCVSCHKAQKHKGGLRMDSYAQLMQGGEDGPVVVPGNPKASELIRRVLLPPGDDDSMPSDGGNPLTPEEIQIIARWIAAGAKTG